MRRHLALVLLASTTAACVHAPAIPEQSKEPDFGRAGTLSKIEERVIAVREECNRSRDVLRKEARTLERSHNVWAVLGSSFGAGGGVTAALGAAADDDKAVRNTLTVTGALLAAAGAVATGLSSKEADLMNKLSERALKIKSLESDVDALVAAAADGLPGAEPKGDALLTKKLDDLREACAEP